MKILIPICARSLLPLALVVLSAGAFAAKEPEEYKAMLFSLAGCEHVEVRFDMKRAVENNRSDLEEYGIKYIDTRDKKWCGIKLVYNRYLANSTMEFNVGLTDVDLWDQIVKFFKIKEKKR